MMKFEFVMDVYPWSTNKERPPVVYGNHGAPNKMAGATRYLVIVDVPDPRQIDA
jgi:hypothetical protein